MKTNKILKTTIIFSTIIVFCIGTSLLLKKAYDNFMQPKNEIVVKVPNEDEQNIDEEDNDLDDENKQDIDNSVNANVTSETLAKPFNDAAVVSRYFYKLNDSEDKQANSLSFFEGVYRPNLGVDYSYNNENFNVIAAASGIVESVTTDEMMGNTVIIVVDKVRFLYQSLEEISVKENDKIKQGQVIGKASSNIFNKELNNHLHFVIEKDNRAYNAEDYYGKKISDIK